MRFHLSCLMQSPVCSILVLLKNRMMATLLLLLVPQARFTYEMAMANKDASSVDEGVARDYDDRLSDDSSGELS